MRLSWRRIVLWYVAMILLCALGSLLAYESPLSSQAWRLWSGAGAWKRDAMRAVVSALLSLFVLWNLEILPSRRFEPRPPRLLRMRYEWILSAIIVLLLAGFNFFILPESFVEGLKARKASVPITFREIMVPYFPYFIYSLSFWLGIVTPPFFFLIRRARTDIQWWSRARARLYESLSKPVLVEELTLGTFQELLAAFQNYVIGLKNIAERYLPVLLAMSLALLHEQLTSAHLTATPTAVEAAKAASWLFLGPALILFITLVALGYQSAVKKVETGFSPYIELLVKSPDKSEVLSAFLVLRTNFIWQQSPLTFIITAVKSASVAIPLLLAVTAYILKSVLDQTPWTSLFLPNAVIELLKNLYR